jgi:galactokinase
MNNRAWVKGEACGRIDFLGGVADYSGAWVLEVPISAKTTVKVRAAAGLGCSVNSRQEGKFAMFPDAWTQFQAATSLRSAREALDRAGIPSWGRYVLGCIAVLRHHRKWSPDLHGPLDFEIDSQMPLGMGVSEQQCRNRSGYAPCPDRVFKLVLVWN